MQKKILNICALIISSFLVAHFFAGLTRDPAQQKIMIVIGIFVDIAAQAILALSKKQLRDKKYIGAAFLFINYLIYIYIFAIPSAITYCSTGFAVAEQAEAKQEYTENISKDRLLQIQAELKVLTSQLQAEARSGYGKDSQTITARIDKLSAEQKTLQKSFQSSGKVPQTSATALELLSKVYDRPPYFLLQVLISVVTWMVYLILILTSWDLEWGKPKVKEGNELSEKVPETLVEVEKVPDTLKKVPEEVLEVQKEPDTFIESSKELLKVTETLDEEVPKVPSEFETFIEAAIKESGSLRSIERVAERIGLPLERCNTYRLRLDLLEIDGRPVISKGRGASKVNFPKDVILKNITG